MKKKTLIVATLCAGMIICPLTRPQAVEIASEIGGSAHVAKTVSLDTLQALVECAWALDALELSPKGVEDLLFEGICGKHAMIVAAGAHEYSSGETVLIMLGLTAVCLIGAAMN